MRSVPVTILAGLLVCSVQATEPVTVTPIRITETRTRQFKGESGFGATNEMKLILHVEGKPVASAACCGQIEVTEAKDNAGNDLRPEKRGFFRGLRRGFEPVRSGMLGMFQPKDQKGFYVELSLAPASRKATRIATLKGQFQVLVGGQEHTVTVSKLPGRLGKPIEDPTLKAAGLKVKLLDPKQRKASALGGLLGLSPEGPALGLQIEGDLTALKEVEVVNAQGRDLVSATMSTGSQKSKTYTYSLKEPLTDKVTLKIHVYVGLKKTTVSFDLKDIELP